MIVKYRSSASAATTGAVADSVGLDRQVGEIAASAPMSFAPAATRRARGLARALRRGRMPIFSGTIQEGTCADGNRNGTHVAGTISANTNTPHLSGIAAVIRARYSTATASAIVGKLDGAVDDLGPAARAARARPSCVRRASRRAHR